MIRLLLTLGVLLSVVGCTSAPSAGVDRAAADPGGYRGGTSLPDPYVMPDLTLTDTSGQPYNLATSPSKPVTLMFFGYTNCPDVCIAVLSDVSLALQRIPVADRDQIQVVFITTDPARDTPAEIKKYLGRFDPDFIGLTGPVSTIKRAAHQVGVEIEELDKLPGGGYDVGHSAQVIGFDRAAGVVLWTPGSPVGSMAHDFSRLVERAR